jgi:transposase
LRAELPRMLATPPEVLSPRMVRVISDLAEDWRRLDERIDQLSDEIAVLARQDAGCERLMSVPGIGPIISSAMVAAIGTGEAVTSPRGWASCLSRCRPATALSLARYRSAVTATCALTREAVGLLAFASVGIRTSRPWRSPTRMRVSVWAMLAGNVSYEPARSVQAA